MTSRSRGPGAETASSEPSRAGLPILEHRHGDFQGCSSQTHCIKRCQRSVISHPSNLTQSPHSFAFHGESRIVLGMETSNAISHHNGSHTIPETWVKTLGQIGLTSGLTPALFDGRHSCERAAACREHRRGRDGREAGGHTACFVRPPMLSSCFLSAEACAPAPPRAHMRTIGASCAAHAHHRRPGSGKTTQTPQFLLQEWPRAQVRSCPCRAAERPTAAAQQGR